MADQKQKLGWFVSPDDNLLGRRDAVHAPVVIVTSQQYLDAGSNVRFVDHSCTTVKRSSRATRHAIVDPFLTEEVEPGKQFYVLLVPHVVGNLVHHFDVIEHNNKPAPYPGTKTAGEIEDAHEDMYDFWSEWAGEALHEFENQGTECCPEYDYPPRLFSNKGARVLPPRE